MLLLCYSAVKRSGTCMRCDPLRKDTFRRTHESQHADGGNGAADRDKRLPTAHGRLGVVRRVSNKKTDEEINTLGERGDYRKRTDAHAVGFGVH